jgi:hypothetical protein
MTAHDEVAALAKNLAWNCGYAVFPCRNDESPATPNGFKNASRDADAINALWHRYPGPLIGVATGEASGIAVLDVDPDKGDEVRGWWHQNEHRLPATRTYRTHAGGLHLYFRHAPGQRNVNGKPVSGIDVRAEGGYIVSWFAAGYECLDHSPPAMWPEWLRIFFWPPSSPPPRRHEPSFVPRALEGLIRTVREATDGTGSSKSNWAAFRQAEARDRLIQAATHAGLRKHEVERTISPHGGCIE